MGSSSGYASAARREAAHILSGPPYTTKPGPAPLRGVLHAIGHLLDDVFGPIVRWIVREIFGPTARFGRDLFGTLWWLALAVIAVAVGVGIGFVLIRRRARIATQPASADAVAETVDIGALERAADAAEAAGHAEEAVRLRFQAGLARLESIGVIANRFVATSHEVQRVLTDITFDTIAVRHEAIAYAGAAASQSDVTNAREGWPQVLGAVTKARATPPAEHPVTTEWAPR